MQKETLLENETSGEENEAERGREKGRDRERVWESGRELNYLRRWTQLQLILDLSSDFYYRDFFLFS